METQTNMVGCQSTNHSACYGELWQCQRCGKTVCYAEGTDDDRTICDDCWVTIHYPQYTAEQPRGTTLLTAPVMQRVITQLLEQQGINVTDPMAFLWLALPEHPERLIIERVEERYLSVALAHPEGDGYFTLAPEVYFVTDVAGWKPIPFGNTKTTEALTRFVEAWAGRIEAEGWLTTAVALPEPPWQVDNKDAPWPGMFEDGDDICFDPDQGQEEELCDIPF